MYTIQCDGLSLMFNDMGKAIMHYKHLFLQGYNPKWEEGAMVWGVDEGERVSCLSMGEHGVEDDDPTEEIVMPMRAVS